MLARLNTKSMPENGAILAQVVAADPADLQPDKPLTVHEGAPLQAMMCFAGSYTAGGEIRGCKIGEHD